MLVLAAVRDDIASFVGTLFFVYTLLIIAYILSSLYFAFGGRMPYSRWSSAVLGFLRDVCEPYLGFFGASSRPSARSTSARSWRSSCSASPRASSNR